MGDLAGSEEEGGGKGSWVVGLPLEPEKALLGMLATSLFEGGERVGNCEGRGDLETPHLIFRES